MTIKLYNDDSYSREFEAKVINCTKCDNEYWIELDQTLFFPEEGGQTPDKGKINNIDVLDVQLKDGIINHKLATPLEPGTKIIGIIDWKHRFSNMQMHSGEHIFSGLVHSKFGYNNVGFHLSDNSATMDYDGKISDDDLTCLEYLANKAIWEGHKINVVFPTREEAEKLDYRSKSGIQGDLRIVEIEGIDLCACCAPHVRNTSEIGIFKIVSAENYKGGTRINFLCGERAYMDYMRLTKQEIYLSRLLNSKKENILDNIEKMKNDLEKLQYELLSFRRQALLDKINKNTESFLFLPSDEADLLRFAATEMGKNNEEFYVVFAGSDDTNYRFIAEGNVEKIKDFMDKLKASFEVKGGGKPGSVQGSVTGTSSDIIKILVQ